MAKGALALRLQRRTACKIQNGPKMADGVWKGVNPKVLGRFKQLLLNKFFDPSSPSMRNGRNGEKKLLSNCPKNQSQLGENSSVRDFKFFIIDLVMVNYAKSIKNHPLTQEVLVRPV